uniref:G patch domain and ankyrin repeat-containing protein 1 n=1 Tax=Petromyzon marinus TaxID=7757 RepID=A0AAJ7XHT1_PETMA|nr:G patch domain and ankyrin repeat-containing protein 1 [Petromyzon marinus]XP_032833755.1 G patch domain and ankyrin repeat-containing protein 1 [Petromyzon marinus]XP_032833765.1 G patch domain and ankyrin repeat-containing protein 1 [Petromyzon marinus]XP_032833775.1 G patch domain and ankyrin repeat-containing protein 1 [Petromyzon marinus]XP_032833783.1 G patch domain and ankyrin repeat-containing protein 1 [Petromyzon marinus]
MDRVKLIDFTPASAATERWCDGEARARGEKETLVPRQVISGTEARSFYEHLLAADSAQTTPAELPENKLRRQQRRERRRERRREKDTPIVGQRDTGRAVTPAERQRAGHRLLKCAQLGDVEGQRQVLAEGLCDATFRDSFGWTALMCAAHAGHINAVRMLLEEGGEEQRHDEALRLASGQGHGHVEVALRDLAGIKERERAELERARQEAARRRWCEICAAECCDAPGSRHEASTVHLLSRDAPLPPTHYHIPESSVGFRLMLRDGWDKETGLGPDGKGRKFPIKTVLKRDLTGLGFKRDLPARVTHFSAHDEDAVRRAQGPQPPVSRIERAATLGRRAASRQEARARDWERDLRSYMNTD